MPELDAVGRLVSDGLLRRDGPRLRTTRRWQAGLARAAAALQRADAPWRDLRLPLAAALAAWYPEAGDEELAELVEAALPVEEAELAPALGPPSGP
jgi:hypothetical protein